MLYEPVYIKTFLEGKLGEKIKEAEPLINECTLCPRNCMVNRNKESGTICKTGNNAMVSSFSPHFGEESPLVGTNGSGTIFFTNCSLLCNFCQNYDISHEMAGKEIFPGELADMMLFLQKRGCHNINFVTPTHVVHQILSALEIAIGFGLKIPLVYNSSGYDKVETLKILEGVIDIYMPDFKFWNPDTSGSLCDASDYPEVARKAISEMHRQVGDLEIVNEIATRGLLIRHLVMPGMLEDTRQILKFIHNDISPNTYVNVMSQYRPQGKAWDNEQISRPLSFEEYRKAILIAKHENITRLDHTF